MSAALQWYVVMAYWSAEWQAHTGMLDRGIRSFFPFLFDHARRGRWVQAKITPQYPGYLFAGLINGQSIEDIRRVVGVRDVLKDRQGVVLVSEQAIKSCKAQWLKDYRVSVPRRRKVEDWQVGDWVPIPEGACVGMPGQIDSIDKSGFVSVSLGRLKVTFHVSAIPETVRDRVALAKMGTKTTPRQARYG